MQAHEAELKAYMAAHRGCGSGSDVRLGVRLGREGDALAAEFFCDPCGGVLTQTYAADDPVWFIDSEAGTAMRLADRVAWLERYPADRVFGAGVVYVGGALPAGVRVVGLDAAA